MNRAAPAICVLAAALAGCSTVAPAEYSAKLQGQDPKWNSPACRDMRSQAATYSARERKIYWAAGAVIGPYGLALVAAGKEHQAKQRRLFMRDMHLACSSKPLPRELAALPASKPPR